MQGVNKHRPYRYGGDSASVGEDEERKRGGEKRERGGKRKERERRKRGEKKRETEEYRGLDVVEVRGAGRERYKDSC